MRALLLGLIASVAFAAASPASLERQIIGAEQDHSLAGESGDCEHFYKTTFTTFHERVHDQEQRELDLEGIHQIKVTAGQEGGLSIHGWNRSNARLVICRYAVANTKPHAKRVLSSIAVSSRNGEIAAYGPQTDATQAWWVNMILYVPRKANVDVKAANGGVAIHNMSGRVTAHATTGGVSVAHSTGRYKITTESGGITLDRVTGLIEANSRDGAIAFKVADSDVPSIEAKTDEGGYIVCTVKGCDEGQWASNRTAVRIGGGVPDVKLSTSGASILIAPVTY